MDICLPIRDIYVRKILDSGGSPAVEAEVLAGEDIVGTCILYTSPSPRDS